MPLIAANIAQHMRFSAKPDKNFLLYEEENPFKDLEIRTFAVGYKRFFLNLSEVSETNDVLVIMKEVSDFALFNEGL